MSSLTAVEYSLTADKYIITDNEYKKAASLTTLRITDEARENLKALDIKDLCSWTGVSQNEAKLWKNKMRPTISLENAVKINTFACKVIVKLYPEDIEEIYVQDEARKRLKAKKANRKLPEIVKDVLGSENPISESDSKRARNLLQKVCDGKVDRIDGTFARKTDNHYLSYYHPRAIFDVDNLFSKTVSYVQSILASVPPSSTSATQSSTS